MDVIGISEVTGFPEIMDGRLKPSILIFTAMLAVRDNEEHMAQINEHGIAPIDLVVVNLYPFKETISKEDVTYDEAIENIDIGGTACCAPHRKPSGCDGHHRSGRLQLRAQ